VIALDQIDSYWLSQVKDFLVAEPTPNSLSPVVERFATNAIRSLHANRGLDASAAAHDAVNASQDDPSSTAFALSLLACSYLLQNETSAASEAIAKALIHRPDHPSLIYSAGLVELRRGDVAAAVKNFERAVEISPELGLAWAGLAVIRSLQQDHVRTEIAARRAIALNAPLGGKLVELTLLQATYRLGKAIEGPCDFSALQQDPEAILEDLLPRLPPVPEEAFDHPANDRPILFIYADHSYVIKHAIPLILSLKAIGTGCRIHLHVANPGFALQSLIKRLRMFLDNIPLVVSTETVQPTHFAEPPVFYSCARFIRLYSLLKRSRQPVLLLDADLLARNDPKAIFEAAPDADVILPESKHDPFWGRIFAGGVGLRPTPGGLTYAASVAAVIGDNLKKQTGRWFLDQIALEICRDNAPPDTRFAVIPKQQMASRSHAASAFFSSVVNEQKDADNAHTRLKKQLIQEAGFAPLLSERKYQTTTITTPSGLFLVDTDDSVIGRSVRQTGQWCSHEIELLSKFLGPGQTVVDGGANIGTHTVALAKLVGSQGRVYAFEPQRLVFQQLAGNLALNQLTNVFAFQKGLSNSRATMFVDAPKFPGNFGAVRLCGEEAQTLEEVAVMRLDDLVLDACHLLKLDVETMEHAAIEGAIATITRHRPVMYIENHDMAADSPLIRLIHSFGFRMFWHGVATKNPNMICLPTESPVQVMGLEAITPC
jgi:FkbM family methyltransferase